MSTGSTTPFFEVLGAEHSKIDVVELWSARGQFNDTVFEVLGAENSKNGVVELWGGVGVTGAPGRSSTTPFLRFWGLKTPKTMSLNSGGGGGVTGDGRSPGGVQRHRF